jgi:curved DNA-binding protein CbpA
MKVEDAAGILGVPLNADLDTLKAAYRRLALAAHPDKVRNFLY